MATCKFMVSNDDHGYIFTSVYFLPSSIFREGFRGNLSYDAHNKLVGWVYLLQIEARMCHADIKAIPPVCFLLLQLLNAFEAFMLRAVGTLPQLFLC